MKLKTEWEEINAAINTGEEGEKNYEGFANTVLGFDTVKQIIFISLQTEIIFTE